MVEAVGLVEAEVEEAVSLRPDDELVGDGVVVVVTTIDGS